MRKRTSGKGYRVGSAAHGKRSKTIQGNDGTQRHAARETLSGSWGIYAEVGAQIVLAAIMAIVLTSFVNHKYFDSPKPELSKKIDTLIKGFKEDLQKIEDLKQTEIFNTYQKK